MAAGLAQTAASTAPQSMPFDSVLAVSIPNDGSQNCEMCARLYPGGDFAEVYQFLVKKCLAGSAGSVARLFGRMILLH
jgi:hypothetical protein